MARATTINGLSSWHKAGWVKQIFFLEDIGQVKGKLTSLYLETQKIDFPTFFNREYKLEFIFVDWIPDVQLTFWEDLE